MKTPARSATCSMGSPTSASMVTSSGKNRILTLIISERVKLGLDLNEPLRYQPVNLKQLLVVRGSWERPWAERVSLVAAVGDLTRHVAKGHCQKDRANNYPKSID